MMLHANIVLAKDVALRETVRQLREYDRELGEERQRVAGLVAVIEDAMSETGQAGSFSAPASSEITTDDGFEQRPAA